VLKKDYMKLRNGLYRVHWRDGGTSLAAIGTTCSGGKWVAPTNWVTVQDTDQWVWRRIIKVDSL